MWVVVAALGCVFQGLTQGGWHVWRVCLLNPYRYVRSKCVGRQAAPPPLSPRAPSFSSDFSEHSPPEDPDLREAGSFPRTPPRRHRGAGLNDSPRINV